MLVRKARSWEDNWANVVRDILFPDERLKTQMMIPTADQQQILQFIQKYFIPDEAGSELLTDENVRVLYYDSEGREFGDGVLKRYLHFDIYVRKTQLFNVTKDTLKRRDVAIARRLMELLTGKTYVANMRYRYEDAYDLMSKYQNYKRYHIVFSYKITYK